MFIELKDVTTLLKMKLGYCAHVVYESRGTLYVKVGNHYLRLKVNHITTRNDVRWEYFDGYEPTANSVGHLIP
jgi:hypothetical protein